MNSKPTIKGLVAAIAVLSGAMGLSVTGAFSDQTIAQSVPNSGATGFLMGQVMIEAHNADGELIAYRLGDNEVVDDGEQCIMKMLFGSSGGLLEAATDDGRGQYLSQIGTEFTADATQGACTGILTGAWDVIAVGEGLNMCAGGSCTATAAHDVIVIMGNELVGNDMDRNYATTKTWTNGTADTTTKIILKRTFTTSESGGVTVTESGLFNATVVDGSGMLAHKTFAGVVLAENDSITVQWTFTVGN